MSIFDAAQPNELNNMLIFYAAQLNELHQRSIFNAAETYAPLNIYLWYGSFGRAAEWPNSIFTVVPDLNQDTI